VRRSNPEKDVTPSGKLVIFLLFVGIFLLIVRENFTKRPDKLYQTTTGRVEMCLACHQKEKLDQAHNSAILGCSPCHLGDAFAFDKQKAHKGIVKNPGDLRIVERTCGTSGCHGTDPQKVKKSLMATNRGILATLLYYWGETDTQQGNFSVEQLMADHQDSLAIDYYRKLCATCHLWKQRGDLEGFFGEKGGGCTACHNVAPEPGPAAGAPDPEAQKPHPLIVRNIPSDNCIRCHNRSGRIGISYTGRFEAEGYGTPYENGGLSSHRLPGDRFYLELDDDVHHEKGLHCIDCHTRNEVMGDGNAYTHYEEATEIECISCHSETPGTTRKNNRLPQIIKDSDGYVQISKLDNRSHPLKPPKKESCDFPGHQRLSCESCHSSWVPQCYGCHVKRDMSDTHLDKLTLQETDGWWEEGRSYIRYEQPMLAVWGEKIVVVTPGCQDIVTLVDQEGNVTGGFNRLTMAAINPHTIQAKGRSCADCHASSKTVGLGEGMVWKEEGEYRFTPVNNGIETPFGTTVPLDAYVSMDGEPLQNSSRPDLRPFNGEELRRILRVGECLGCHEQNDPVFANYSQTMQCPEWKE
jgi:hypothetical protein